MHWKTKAAVMRLCASIPLGSRLYIVGQKRFGRLDAQPMAKLPAQAEMARWLIQAGVRIDGLRLLEVGTGHIPMAPIGFFLSGAESVTTVDLHRRIDWGLVRKSLEWIAEHRNEVRETFRGIVDDPVFDKRFRLLKRYRNDPASFFTEAGIEYLAPVNASDTGLPTGSIDCHFSITVLEHIPPAVLREVFVEAKRILKPHGLAVHFVDLSDHFQHMDGSISQVNFLRYSNAEWQGIAGNEFAYCNRLRVSDYLGVFNDLGLTVERHEAMTDPESVSVVSRGEIDLDSHFAAYESEDLCSTTLRILLRRAADISGE